MCWSTDMTNLTHSITENAEYFDTGIQAAWMAETSENMRVIVYALDEDAPSFSGWYN